MVAMTNTAPHPPRSPRDYAAVMLAEPSLERRQQLLAACPEQWRELVAEHVANGFARIKAYRQHLAARAGLASQKPPAAPRREEKHDIVNHPRSAPEVGNAAIAKLRAAVGAEGAA